MNKVILLIYLLFIMSFFPAGCRNNDAHFYNSASSELAISHIDSSRLSDSIIFRVFPNNFKDFNQVYGYSDESGPGRLYDRYLSDIRYFCDSLSISIETQVMRLISIAVGGEWDADAVNELQICIRKKIFTSPNEFFKLLEQKSSGEVKSFWYFVLDGPHPEDNIENQFFIELSQMAREYNAAQLILIREARNEVLQIVH